MFQGSQARYVTYCSKKKDEIYNELLPASKRYKSERIQWVYKRAIENDAEFRILSGYFGLLDPNEKIPYYGFLLTREEDIDRLTRIIKEQLLDLLKSAKSIKIKYFTEEPESDKKVCNYYRALKKALDELADSNVELEIIIIRKTFEIIESGKKDIECV